jgi:hypothetical protein
MNLRRSLRLAGQPAPQPAELLSCRRVPAAVVVGPEVLLEERIAHYRKYKHYETDFGWPETRAMQEEYARLLGVTQRDLAHYKARNVAADGRHFAQLNAILQQIQSAATLVEKCKHISQVLVHMHNHPELLAGYPSFRKQAKQQLEVFNADLERAMAAEQDDETEHAIIRLQSMIPSYVSYLTTLLPRHPLYVSASN